MTPNWKQGVPASAIGDRRKLVTLEVNGMIRVCIRAWDGTQFIKHPDLPFENVLAWDDLPAGTFSNGVVRGTGLTPNIPPAAIAKS